MAPSELEDSQYRERESSEDDLYSEELALRELSATNSKRRRLSEDEKELSCRGVKLAEGIGSALYDSLVEKIIVRLPFKSLFQAPSLSNSWRSRFRSDPFQREVQRSGAASWKSYAPVCVNRKMDLVGYESSSKRWHVLPNHSYLQPDVVKTWLRAGAGSLLCWIDPNGPRPFCFCRFARKALYHVHVTNPLTRSLRQLPTRPNMNYPHLVHVVCEGTEAYKVILATPGIVLTVQIFHSTTGAWTLDSYDTQSLYTDWGGIAFIDGVLYLMIRQYRGYNLISFDVEARIWTDVSLRSKSIDGDHQSHETIMNYLVRFSKIFVCGSNVMLVVAHIGEFDEEDHSSDGDDYDDEQDEQGYCSNDDDDDDEQDEGVLQTICVFEIDLGRRLAVEVSRAPNEMATLGVVCSAASDGDFIYIGSRRRSLSIAPIVYNVNTREWNWVNSPTDKLKTSFPDTPIQQWSWTSITYQPGLNPFVKV